jgi:hypothetical protein
MAPPDTIAGPCERKCTVCPVLSRQSASLEGLRRFAMPWHFSHSVQSPYVAERNVLSLSLVDISAKPNSRQTEEVPQFWAFSFRRILRLCRNTAEPMGPRPLRQALQCPSAFSQAAAFAVVARAVFHSRSSLTCRVRGFLHPFERILFNSATSAIFFSTAGLFCGPSSMRAVWCVFLPILFLQTFMVPRGVCWRSHF